MESTFTKYLLTLPDHASVQKAIRERRDSILEKIEDDFLNATDELVAELAELNIALGEVDHDTKI